MNNKAVPYTPTSYLELSDERTAFLSQTCRLAEKKELLLSPKFHFLVVPFFIGRRATYIHLDTENDSNFLLHIVTK